MTPTYLTLAQKGLLSIILREAVSTKVHLQKPEDFFKAKSEPVRPLLRLERYLTYCGFCASHFLSYIQKLEHIQSFITDGTITPKMKAQGINSYHTLLYNVENFIIRSQGLLERTLILTDAILDLGNDTQFITYKLIVNNGHVKHIKLHVPLKKLRKATEKHHFERNEIIHHQEYMQDDLRRLEAWHIFYETSKYRQDADLYHRLKRRTERELRVKWKNEVEQFLDTCYPIIREVLLVIAPSYERAKIQFAEAKPAMQ